MNTTSSPIRLFPALVAGLLASASLTAQGEPPPPAPEPIAPEPMQTLAQAMADAEADVLRMHELVMFLSDPFLEGRMPGTRGMQIAREYMAWNLQKAGLKAPFTDVEGNPSYLQPFDFARTASVQDGKLVLKFPGDAITLTDGMQENDGEDFMGTFYGGEGAAVGDLVFVGYGVQNGPDGYTCYDETTDLTGKVAVLLWFSPLDAEGGEKWGRRDRFTHGRSQMKLSLLEEKGAAAVLAVMPPGAGDQITRRYSEMMRGRLGSKRCDIPVGCISIEMADRLLRGTDPEGRGLAQLQALADESGFVSGLNGSASISFKQRPDNIEAANIGGLLEGFGPLKDEVLVVGGHIDHLGLGDKWGSRAAANEKGKLLHPGADDNATGTAAVIMLAEQLAADYAEMGATPRRSILFMGFDAEEAGLHGARAYVTNPIVPMEKHAFMINFDMLGRMQESRITVGGVATATGLEAFLQPAFDDSGLEVNAVPSMGGSDHMMFAANGVPNLFGHTGVHPDYHTPRDTTDKINYVGAAESYRLFLDISRRIVTRTEPFQFANRGSGRRRRQG